MGYDFEWHERHGDATENSAKLALTIIRKAYLFDSVLDVGCGDGRWLRQCANLGATSIAGVDGPWTQMDKLLVQPSFVKLHDLSRPFNLGRRYDLAISLEVAEHISKDSAEIFVSNLIRHSDVVLFGAAIPFQGGYRHINEQWQSYWASLFSRHGYIMFDFVRPRIWNAPNVHYWYKQNMLLYVNNSNTSASRSVQAYIDHDRIGSFPVDMVHPTKYEALASYREIAFKPLLRQLPTKLLRKMSDLIMRRT